MKRMKQILAVLLLLSLLPVIPLVSSAEGETGTNAGAPQTVYVSNAGNDATAEIGNKEKPYKTFLTAYGKLTATGGTVVLLDDVEYDMSNVAKVGDADRIYLSASEKNIHVCGVYHEDSEKYSALRFTGGDAGICFELQGNVVFYDMIFRVEYSQNLWFAANGYDLTFGFNITNDLQSGKAANITGGAQNASAGVTLAPDKGPTVSVYSGAWNNVLGGSFVGVAINGNATVNIIGGSFTNVTSCRNRDASKNALTKSVEIHYYGGTPAVIKKFDKTATLYLYNGMVAPTGSNTDLAENEIIEVKDKSMPAPDYALQFYGTQVTGVENGKYSVRFVGTLNSLNYSAVGMLIQTGSGQEYGGCCEKVYTSILGDFEKYTAEALGGNYIFAWTIANIPTNAGEVSFTVTPFCAIGDTVWYGETETVVYNSGALQQQQ